MFSVYFPYRATLAFVTGYRLYHQATVHGAALLCIKAHCIADGRSHLDYPTRAMIGLEDPSPWYLTKAHFFRAIATTRAQSDFTIRHSAVPCV